MRTIEEIKADIEYLKECDMDNTVIMDCMNELLNYRQAECDGRLVVLPCKVGDTVYVISNEPCPYNCKHQYRNDGQVNIWHKENNNNCKQCEYIDKKYIWEREFYLDDLARVGKTVFLTREEAEKALRKEDEGK